MQMQFQTNLNCASCVSKVKPFLDAEPSVTSWEVDTKDARKVLTVRGDALTTETVKATVEKSGFKVVGEIGVGAAPVATAPAGQSFRPLVLIFAFILGASLLQELDSFNLHRFMANFMGGFFLVFSFFKFLNLEKFADAYSTYDVVAQQWRGYGLVYPFIELALGVAYLGQRAGLAVHVVTLVVMLVSTVGVVRALLKKRQIECACLGTVFNLPMTKVTLFEDLLMVAMAVWMIVSYT